MRPGERPPLALQLVFLGKHIGYLMERHLAQQGLNRTQTMILIALDRRPGLKALDLCAHARVEPANVTRTLQSLERLGLLERRPHPTDRRASTFYLTADGRALARQVSESLERLSADLLQGMDPEEQRLLEGALATLRRNWLSLHEATTSRQPAGSEVRETADGQGTRFALYDAADDNKG